MLNFLNPSRSFDASKSRVQFWGYDSAFEISFYVEAGALKQLCPEITNAETGFLHAFDTARERIVEVAEQIYTKGKKRRFVLVLTAKDFKN
jgi:hypothetical protein